MGENLLGKGTPEVERYAPELLHGIARHEARERLGIAHPPPFVGEDVWRAWELSWLDAAGRPRAAVGRLTVPAESRHLVESKSLKLYLNSLYNTRFASEARLAATIGRDLRAVLGVAPGVELLPLDAPALRPRALPGECIDSLPASVPDGRPRPELLARAPGAGGRWHSHLLRTLCPFTGQPDWASVVVACEGCAPEPASLLAYLLAFRRHRGFHEQLAEQVFCDLRAALAPRRLSVQALFTRRGGLDINPWRSSDSPRSPMRRAIRQ